MVVRDATKNTNRLEYHLIRHSRRGSKALSVYLKAKFHCACTYLIAGNPARGEGISIGAFSLCGSLSRRAAKPKSRERRSPWATKIN
jgi:hypothetical protein